ncbi:histidine kinase N-terminal 7TM domain-containing diguanylate cyclase [Saccharibacillus sacchari]|uniref:histidine kinase N-terminal 7TM domain-containing diguanylate cyclase n=1 Tax=Saccharibacillus sacchari TaxID=456493 RepID=UPI0004B371CA|nr:diguanylate cyclase [Saccharibacillus sacchari]
MNLSVWYDLFLFALLSVLLVYIFFAVRITNLHKVYFVFHFFMMLWPLCQFATHIVQDVQLQFLYVSLSFVASLMLASGWLLFTLFLAGDEKRLSPKSIALLFVPAAVASLGTMINPFHLFASPTTDNYVDRSYGSLFWLTMTVIAGYFLTSLVVLLRAVRSHSSSPSLKKQIRIVLWGVSALVSFVAIDILLNVVLAKFLPIIPGLTSLGIFIADLFFIFVITRYKVFDLVSIAHEDIINTIPHGILVLDEDDAVVEANRALRLFIDAEVGELFDIETFLSSVRAIEDPRQFLNHYKRKERDLFQIELTSNRGDGLHFILQTSPIFDASRSPIGHILTFQDVSQERRLVQELNRQNDVLHERNRSLDRTRLELSQANRKLEEMALTDSLTGCYNRHYLTQRLTQEMTANVEQRIPFSFILFDIDFFKMINDRHGHVAGDEVLYRTAQIVKQRIRSTDILARYGGEEFILYLPCTERKMAEKIAEQVRAAVESNFVKLDQSAEPVNVTVSLGVLSIEDFEHQYMPDNLEEYLTRLFAEVDKPLYQAKKNGRNRIEFADIRQISDDGTFEARM